MVSFSTEEIDLAVQTSAGRLAATLRRGLLEHVVGPWFSRVYDPDGGFFQTFDEAWQPIAEESRGAVFQSRITWLLAALVADGIDCNFPCDSWAKHGVDFLIDHMIDRETGAVLRRVTKTDAGLEIEPGDKDAYSSAFALFALAANASIGNERALGAAKRLFHWIESNLHDQTFKGYFSRDSVQISNPASTVKEQNPHLHLLEALIELAAVWPDELVLMRLAEQIELFESKFFHPAGHLHITMSRDWCPVEGSTNYGHDLEVAHLLIRAKAVLQGNLVDVDFSASEQLMRHSLKFGWDENKGGIFSFGTDLLGPADAVKVWWVQFEGLLALIYGHAFLNDDAEYLDRANDQWQWIRRNLADQKYGGFYEAVGPQGPVGFGRKGHDWKSAYHDGRALLLGSRMLVGIAD